MDIKAGDLLECVRSDDSELITEGKTYPVVLSEGGILSLRTDIDGMLLVYLENYLEPKASGSLKFKKVENMKQFKEGDLVFELSFYKGIKVTNITVHKGVLYPIETSDSAYTANGFDYEDERGLPSLLHATPENRAKLVAIWGEDAVPTLPLRGSELTKKRLEGQKMQACLCDDDNDHMALNSGELRLIIEFSGGYFYDIDGNGCKSAVSVDNQGNEITELSEPHDER